MAFQALVEAPNGMMIFHTPCMIILISLHHVYYIILYKEQATQYKEESTAGNQDQVLYIYYYNLHCIPVLRAYTRPAAPEWRNLCISLGGLRVS